MTTRKNQHSSGAKEFDTAKAKSSASQRPSQRSKDFITLDLHRPQPVDVIVPEEFRWLVGCTTPRPLKDFVGPPPTRFFLWTAAILLVSTLPTWGTSWSVLAFLIGGILAYIGLLLLIGRDRELEALLSQGALAFGRIVETEEGQNEGGEWVDLWYQFKISDGSWCPGFTTVDVLNREIASAGSVFPVFYDSQDPSRNRLCLDLDRVIRPRT